MRSRDALAHGKFGAPYTTNYIVDEIITLLRTRASFESSLKFKEKVEKTKVLRIIWVEEELTAKANEIFKAYPELRLSFTDSTSFAVMQQLGIRSALTFDNDFQAFGFQVVS